jgi:Tol biopolymer transport system component/DNA-binding winged helix-turn-helix (wHTH) protein
MGGSASNFYEFGPYTLDARERVLLREGEIVRLTPKEFETLLSLVRGGGRVMSKEELLKEIWHDTFVGEATLAQNVFTLRKALGEAEGGKSYIETVPRRGYRFAARVREVTKEESESETDEGAGVGRAAPTEAGGRRLAAVPDLPNTRTTEGALEGDEQTSRHAESLRETNNSRAVAAQFASAATAATTTTPAPTQDESATRQTPKADGHPVRAAILITVVVLAVVASVAYLIFRFSVRPEAKRSAPAFESMKVTRLPVTGSVTEAAISPDGKTLAYVADEPGRQGASIWVRQVTAASNTQQVVAPAEGTFYGGLVFSRDGAHIYFGAVKVDNHVPALYRVPVLGGPPEKIIEHYGGNGPATFSPDGKQIAFTREDSGDAASLVLANADGGGERTLVTRKGSTILGLPAWSPDGRTIACVYGSTEKVSSSSPYLGVTAFNASDGAETRVTEARWLGVSQIAWLPDSSGVVMSASEEELSPSQIWQLSFPSGEVRRVTNDLNTYLGASLTADGSALVTVQTDRVPNVWVAPASDTSRAVQITTGTGKFDGYYGLSWTPDGRIVYSSIASGSWDIWVMNADGTNQKQLTVGAKSNYGPSVSADGRYIVFVSNRAGAFNVWRMDADGSNPKQLTAGTGENFAHVTPDGRWVIYATVGYGQDDHVWKVSIDGGDPVKLTDKPASWPFVSPDGKSFVCAYGFSPTSAPKLAVIPTEGGQPVKLFDISPGFRANTVWLPDNRGIAFVDSRTGTNNVWVQPLGGGKPVQLTDFKSDGVSAYDFSRDGRLAASRSVETTGVVLIKDFR